MGLEGWKRLLENGNGRGLKGGGGEAGSKHNVERKPCKQRNVGGSTRETFEKWCLLQSY